MYYVTLRPAIISWLHECILYTYVCVCVHVLVLVDLTTGHKLFPEGYICPRNPIPILKLENYLPTSTLAPDITSNYLQKERFSEPSLNEFVSVVFSTSNSNFFPKIFLNVKMSTGRLNELGAFLVCRYCTAITIVTFPTSIVLCQQKNILRKTSQS